MNELELTLGWVAKSVGGTLQSGDPELPVGDVLTDSRSLRAVTFLFDRARWW